MENMSREKERSNRAQDYSTTQEVASSAQAEEDSFEGVEAGQEVNAEGSGFQDKLKEVKTLNCCDYR